MIALPCPLPDRPMQAIAGTGCGAPDVRIASHVADADRLFISDYESFFEFTRRDGTGVPARRSQHRQEQCDRMRRNPTPAKLRQTVLCSVPRRALFLHVRCCFYTLPRSGHHVMEHTVKYTPHSDSSAGHDAGDANTPLSGHRCAIAPAGASGHVGMSGEAGQPHCVDSRRMTMSRSKGATQCSDGSTGDRAWSVCPENDRYGCDG